MSHLNYYSQTKMAKGEKFGYKTAILHLAPYKLSGKNVCPKASKECIAFCLNTSGRGQMNSVQQARINKTNLFWKDRKKFLVKLSQEIEQLKKRASIAERTDRFTIQITSKKMLKDAQLFSQNLIGQGYDSYIQKVVFNSDEIWYRVRVGSYDNYNSAKTAADALSSTLEMPTWVDFVRKEQ